MTSTVSSQILSNNLKRLLKDVRDILKNPLTSHGIYYIHDENNCTIGYSLIIGPNDTLYRHGFYFFKLEFPNDYPFSPPIVTYLTNGENIRFNPNLYRNGKVCLSILNTWKGEQWTSCQNIRSVLLTLISHVFHNEPILNEPGVTKRHPSYNSYHQILRWANYKVAFHDVIKKAVLPEPQFFKSFYIFIKKYIITNRTLILDDLKQLTINEKKETIKSSIYSMKNEIDYSLLNTNIMKLFEQQKI